MDVKVIFRLHTLNLLTIVILIILAQRLGLIAPIRIGWNSKNNN